MRHQKANARNESMKKDALRKRGKQLGEESYEILIRDDILKLLRSDTPLRRADRDLIASEYERVWRPDIKRQNKIYQANLAFIIDYRLAELRKSGRSVAEARDKLARDLGHNSGEALEKWLRRNREKVDAE